MKRTTLLTAAAALATTLAVAVPSMAASTAAAPLAGAVGPGFTITLKKGGKVNVPSVKAKLVGFLGAVVHSTDKMISQIKHVGAPDVKNGSKIQSGVLSAFNQLDTAFKQAKSSAQKLPTGSAKAFSTKAEALAQTIQSSANRIGVAFSALDKYSTKELNDAAKNDKTCAKLGG